MLDRAQLRRALKNDSSVCSPPTRRLRSCTLLKAHYRCERAAGRRRTGAQQAIDEAVAELVASSTLPKRAGAK
jgi:hypothetical protein